MDKRVLIAVGAVLLILIALLGFWALQGRSMEADFGQALRCGVVRGLHRDLQGKHWTPDELGTIEVLKVPAGAGRERAVARAIHARGRIYVSGGLYEFQATVRDSATKIVHVFGYRRSEPRHWCWDQIHPSSMPLHMQRRLDQLEAMKQRAAMQQQQ